MNILFLTQNIPIPSNGGIERVVYNLTNELIKYPNINIRTCSIGNENEIPENHIILNKNKFIQNLDFLLYKENIDLLIIHVNLGTDIIYSLRKLTNKNTKIIIEHHHCIAKPEFIFKVAISSLNKSTGLKKILKFIFFPLYNIYLYTNSTYAYYLHLKCSDKYVLLSEEFINDLSKKSIISKKIKNKVVAIPNPHKFLAQNYVSNKKNKTFLFVGRIDYTDKNLDALLRIWKLAESDWKLIIVGDGPDLIRLKKQIIKMKLKNIQLEGHKENVTEYYKQSPFLLLTSVEGWGLVLLEGMEHGCLPIAFNSYSSITDIISNGYNGFLIKKNDKKAFAKKIIEVTNKESNSFEEMRRNAFTSIEKFEIKIIVKKWIKLFNELTT